MSIRFFEIPGSRSGTTKELTERRRYKCVGTTSKDEAHVFALGATTAILATSFGNLWRQDLIIDPDGWNQWIIEVPYAKKKKETGAFSWTFDTTGGSAVIKASKEHIKSYPAGDPEDPHKSSIGVTKDGNVEGAEIVIPTLKYSFTFRHPQGHLTLEQSRIIARNTGKTNAEPWQGFSQDELLFLGATGSDGTEVEAEVTYHVAASETATLSIGEIAGILKKGYEYVWIEFKDAVEENAAATQPSRVHVERVYDRMNFEGILGF